MTFAAGDAHQFGIYGARLRVVFPIFLSTGLPPTGTPTGLDSEFSLDQANFADCNQEATLIAGGTTANGVFRLDLIRAETLGKHVCVRVRHTGTSNTNNILSIPINRLPILESGTAQAGAAGTITLASSASTADRFYNGLYVQITNDTPTNVLGMTRPIISYVGSTRVATIDSNWGTTVSSASTYDILVPYTEGHELAHAIGIHPGADPTAPPAVIAGMQAKIDWLCAWARNLQTIDRTTGIVSLRNDANSATIGTMTVADDGTTFTRPEVG